jgi:hypothetical protein
MLGLAGVALGQQSFHITNTGLPGGESGDFNINGYSYYAGNIAWSTTDATWTGLGLPSNFNTLCVSMSQEFNVGSGFDVTPYALAGASVDGSNPNQIDNLFDPLDFSIYNASIPSSDVPPATGNSFLQAANLFGALYGNASVNDAALQIAVWDTLYGYNISQDHITSSTLFGQTSGYLNIASTITDNYAANNYLSNVAWMQFNGGSGGQSQLYYLGGGPTIPNLTPEPITSVLCLGALGLAFRRRIRARA